MPPHLRQLGSVGKVEIWLVDGLWVRHHLEPDFNNFGSWPRFQAIPRDEFWLDREVNHDEHAFYLANLVAERRARQQGKLDDDARAAGAAAEQRARQQAKQPRGDDVVAQVRRRQLATLDDGTAVWLVDGKAVRDHLFQEFVQGGHDLVYDWIPTGEIWLDDTVVPAERALVLRHEAYERKLMNQGMDYDAAHAKALKAEDRAYRGAAPRLAYPTRPASWNIAKQRVLKAADQLDHADRVLSGYDFQSDAAHDFFGGAVQDARSLHLYLHKFASAVGRERLQWWLSNGTFAQLDTFFDLLLRDEYGDGALTTRLLKEVLAAVEAQYQNYYLVFDPKRPVPQDPELAARWEDYFRFSQEVVPVLNALLATQSAIGEIEKFAGYVTNAVQYNQHASRQRRDDGHDPRPPGVAAHEVMWHTTVAYRAILREGFKLRSEQADASAGLGGSMSTKGAEGISFTASREVAEGIAEAYRDMVALLQRPQTPETIQRYCVDVLGLDYDEFMKNVKTLFNPQVPPGGTYTLTQVYNFVRYGLAYSDYAGVRYDPLFMDEGGSPEKLARLNPDDIGIIEAVIDTTHEDIIYMTSMEEWRVPKAAILSIGPLGSQANA